MLADEYQAATKKTAIYPKDQGVLYCILGLTNEAGEVAGKYKKYIRDNSDWHDVRQMLLDELGDVLWYASQLADELETDLSEVMERNVAKLKGRQARGTLGGSGDKR